MTEAAPTRPADRTRVAPSREPADRDRLELVAVGALLAVTAVWGSTFFMLKGVVTRVPAADFLGVRFWIAALVLAALRPGRLLRTSRRALRDGVLLGVCYGAAQLVQTWGLERTSASVSGFVTGMYVVLTPILAGVLLRQRVQPAVWVAVSLATAGLAVLSLHGVSFGYGEALTLVGAGLYALHIVGLAAWSPRGDAYALAVVQMIAVAATCSLAALPGGVTLPHRADDVAVLLYMALASGAGALLLQTWAQAHVPAARAAIVMTFEPVWAGAFAVTLGGEPIGLRLVIGGALVITAMFLAEFGPRRRDPS